MTLVIFNKEIKFMRLERKKTFAFKYTIYLNTKEFYIAISKCSSSKITATKSGVMRRLSL